MDAGTDAQHDALTDTDDAMARHDAWVRAADIPLLVLALASVPLLVLEGQASGSLQTTAVTLNWMIWGLFAFDLLVRLALVPSRRLRYLARNWFDVLIVVLAILPFFRPLRVLRSARVLRLVRALRVIGFLARFWESANHVWKGMHGRLIGVAVLVVVLIGSVGMWMVERDRDGPIDSFADALWWALATVTTVGYGDTYPISPEGRGVAAFMMFEGIAVFGVVSASLAAMLVREDDASDRELELERQVRELNDKLDLMLSKLD